MPDDFPAANDSSIPLNLKTHISAVSLILAVAGASLAYFYSRGLMNLYGDSMAHLEGARRLIDSLTPGYDELGTVWLPIPHLLMAFPAQNDFLWQTGLAGGIVSTAAFALAAWVVFRLGSEMNDSLSAGYVALAGFLLCPNMLYLASTALTEPLAILFVVLLVYGLVRFEATGRNTWLIAAAFAAFAGTLTRYECWSLLPFAALFVLWARPGAWPERFRRALRFSLIAGAGPVLWFLHNAHRYGNPLEFYNGPFSAEGIYAHQLATTAFRFPTDGSLVVSARYYLEDLRLVIGVAPLLLALFGLLVWVVDKPRRAQRSAALLLLLPLPFHIQAMAHAAVPLYVPTLFPNAYWNLRLGMEMLPAAALFPSFLWPRRGPKGFRSGVLAALLLLIVGQHLWTASRGAAELAVAKEGVLNTPCRSRRQQILTEFLRQNYDGGTILIAAGKWPCVLPKLVIPLRRTLSDANRSYWAQIPVAPEQWTEWIVRGDNEPVDWLMRAYPHAFTRFEIVLHEADRQAGSLTVYRRRRN